MPAKGSNGEPTARKPYHGVWTSRPSRELHAEEECAVVHAVVVAGSLLAGELDRGAVAAGELIIAVDGGADAMARAGLTPSLLIGDLDSITPATFADLESRGVELIRLETAKDETDTEAALRLAIERGATEITVFNALGGPRLDHLLGNLLLLTAPWLAPARVTLVDGLHQAFLVSGDGTVSGRVGDTVSLLPLTERVEDVRTEGLLYPLRGETLWQGATRGVSNQTTGESARVTHGAGALLLIHYSGR
jgi:thiamine pyrophosphokinase